MPEKTKKPLTIRDVNVTDIDTFHELRNKKNLTPAGFFQLLLEAQNSTVNSVNTDSLLEKIAELTAVNTGLQTQLDEQTSVNTGLQLELDNKTAELQNAGASPALTGNQFVYEPSPEQYQHMRRVITYLIKKGRIEKDAADKPAKFTNICINFTIKDQYSSILK